MKSESKPEPTKLQLVQYLVGILLSIVWLIMLAGMIVLGPAGTLTHFWISEQWCAAHPALSWTIFALISIILLQIIAFANTLISLFIKRKAEELDIKEAYKNIEDLLKHAETIVKEQVAENTNNVVSVTNPSDIDKQLLEELKTEDK